MHEPQAVWQDALQGEPEAFGQRAAAHVADARAQLHARQTELVDGAANQRPRRSPHDAPPLELAVDPVADVAGEGVRVDADPAAANVPPRTPDVDRDDRRDLAAAHEI